MHRLEDINLNYLMYFWAVAHEGGVSAASQRLGVSQPTISMTMAKLERLLGVKLLQRAGRGVRLTEAGTTAFRYTDEIFKTAGEMVESLRGALPSGKPRKLVVGVRDVLPKTLTYRLLEPVFHLPEPIEIICLERSIEDLLADLALFRLDVVLSDEPASPALRVRAYNHVLGECGVSVFAAAALMPKYRSGFPHNLDGAPFLLPTSQTEMRRIVDIWFDRQGISPKIIGQFEDSALMKEFGHAGVGLFPGPTALETEICAQFGVGVIGRIETARLRFYAITVERKLKHPAVVAISQQARTELLK
jgi:LysR family transcriptional activator of nhaA